MKGNTLSYTSCIATASNNTFCLHSATILTHTLACSHIFFSETKYCYSRNDGRSQLVLFCAIPQSWTWKRAILQTLKIHTRLTKIATTIIFSQWWSGKNEIYILQKIWGVSGSLSIVWETHKLTQYQSREFSYITFLYRTIAKAYAYYK